VENQLRRTTISTHFRINNQIRSPQVRLIDETATQLGTMTSFDALRIAQERGLDLVEIAPQGQPPVCKIMDYSKYIIEEKKKEKEQKRAQRVSQVDTKEIQISPVIQEGDLKVKIKNIQRILEEGNKVRVVVKFSGRQLKHTELGKEIFEKVVTAIPEVIVERQPVFEGKTLFVILHKPATK
jgi:translation initiation factor IF-3